MERRPSRSNFNRRASLSPSCKGVNVVGGWMWTLHQNGNASNTVDGGVDGSRMVENLAPSPSAECGGPALVCIFHRRPLAAGHSEILVFRRKISVIRYWCD
ncbi:hypothetical protein KC19_6G078100 [Ceratodon purpureus]|uniref:Uncharacterized protein n=1 Tax=Ceratodon purpureus TaxID=3225 RepID=A0A8T0HIE1_CERPU|nr:hypothetical protein KC19_6G078100 [Ceratodon purpureus]